MLVEGCFDPKLEHYGTIKKFNRTSNRNPSLKLTTYARGYP
jgi:hypothetical protein